MSAGEWVLVPREPTEAMLREGSKWNTELDSYPDCDGTQRVWGAMLAAAPQPPAEAQAQGGGEVCVERAGDPDFPQWSAVKSLIVTAPPRAPVPLDAPNPPTARDIAYAEAVRHGLISERTDDARTAPPSAPVGAVHAAIQRDIDDHGVAEIRQAELDALTPPSAPVGVEGLVAKWRGLANDALRRSGTWNGNDVADRIEFMAGELETLAQQPAACETCGGRGEVGGLTLGGYESHPCPECEEQQPAADDSTDYRCPDCGKLNYKPLGCANCGYELPVAAQQPAAVPVGVEGPLSVFSAGEWRYSETGQTFSAKDLDEAAFVVYRDHLAQQPSAAPVGVTISWSDFWMRQGDRETSHDYAAFEKAEAWRLAQQPAAVYQCPRCATSMEVDPTAKPAAVDGARRLIGLMREVVPALRATGVNVTLADDVERAAALAAKPGGSDNG